MPRYFVGSYIPDPAAGRIIREKFKAWTEHEARKNAVRRLRRHGLGRIPVFLVRPNDFVYGTGRFRFLCNLDIYPDAGVSVLTYTGIPRREKFSIRVLGTMSTNQCLRTIGTSGPFLV